MVAVYKIWDEQDDGYQVWYGDIDDIIEHVEELHIAMGEQDYTYDVTKRTWIEELEYFGLSFEEIYNKEDECL